VRVQAKMSETFKLLHAEISFLAKLGKKKRAKLDLPVLSTNWLRAFRTTSFFVLGSMRGGGSPNVTKLTEFLSKNFQNPPILVRTHS